MGKQKYVRDLLSDNYTIYDSSGKKVGKLENNFFGGYTKYIDGKKVGSLDNKMHWEELYKYDTFNLDEKEGESGCYIATAIYKSYDCPEVWTLRRYRDYFLYKKRLGRIFIKIYYAISPIFVKLFGKTKLFNKFFKYYLDKKVNRLIIKGYDNTPYSDRF